MKIYLAPMEGVTSYIFRNAHQKYFGGIDKYFTPFLSPNQAHPFSNREKRDILLENNEGIPIVPQILTNKAEHFIRTANVLKEMGYNEVNLNVGCPSGTVTAKKRGAGFLSEPEALDEFLDQIFTELDMKISVKTRLGMEDPEEFETLLEIYNNYPMEELIVHPRIRTDFYKGKPRLDAFAKAVSGSKNKICYNGDLFTKEQYEVWQQQFPDVETIMIGRGAIANPALPLEIRNQGSLDSDTFYQFHQEILNGYLSWPNMEKNVLFKMKELWFYFGMNYPDSKKELKKIKKAQTVNQYAEVTKQLILQ
jgi:tRNA-dihydrouridine synthase